MRGGNSSRNSGGVLGGSFGLVLGIATSDLDLAKGSADRATFFQRSISSEFGRRPLLTLTGLPQDNHLPALI